MDVALVLVACFAYLLASIVYGTYLLRFDKRYARVSLAFLGLGVLFNVGAVGYRLAVGLLELGAHDVLIVSAAIAVVVYLIVHIRRPIPLVGAFLSPVVTMLLYSVHVSGREASFAHRTVVEIVTPVHIGASMLGFLIFAVAAVASVLLIIQEYRLKTKRVPLAGGGGLPSLQTLEKVSHSALILGFPIYTIGVVLGGAWFFRESDPGITRHLIMAAFSWCLYAVTLHARITIGWKGRKAAILTLVAFASALFVVFLSILRSAG